METSKIIGIVFIGVSLITLGIFIAQTEFSIQLTSWISFPYYMQFAPYVISVMLFYGGSYLIRNNAKSNFALAVFGYTIVELVALDWIGLLPNPIGLAATIMFGCCAIVALWISHANAFSSKELSLKEIVISVLIGALESLLLYWMQ